MQENYINKVLDRFDMKDSKPGDSPTVETNLVSSSVTTMTLKEMRCKRFHVHQQRGVQCTLKFVLVLTLLLWWEFWVDCIKEKPKDK
ncbi:hypothetical protein CR513_00117, partial [Mucuna pruriens]